MREILSSKGANAQNAYVSPCFPAAGRSFSPDALATVECLNFEPREADDPQGPWHLG